MKRVEGPVVTVCTGHRCAARGPGLLSSDLRAAIRGTAGGILVSCGCLGRCDLGPLVVVTWSGGGHLVGLAAMDEPARVAALLDWIPSRRTKEVLTGDGTLPSALAEARAEAQAPPVTLEDG